MKHASLKIYRIKFKLPEPMSIATFTWTHLESVLVKLTYANYVGIGEAAPFSGMTGETIDYVISQLKNSKNFVIDLQAESQVFYQQLKNIASCHAAAALDAAYHDLLCKMRNQPVYRLFTNEKNLTHNSLTIPVLKLEEVTQFALKIRDTYPHIKLIKIKLANAKDDIEIIKAIKAVFPVGIAFIIDPNQCFKDSHEAIKILHEIQKILGNVIAIEQPVEKHNYQGLLEIKNNLIGTNIYADESVVTMADLENIIKLKAVDGVNIKIQKAGGIANAKLMAQRANMAGLKIMVGCMMEEPLGVAAGIHFAVSTKNVAFTDLDSDLFLVQQIKEPIFSMLPFVNGSRMPIEKAGLGIEFNENVIENMAKQKNIVYEEV